MRFITALIIVLLLFFHPTHSSIDPAVVWEHSKAKATLANFFKNIPSYPCTSRDVKDLPACVIDMLLKQPPNFELPAFAILKYGSQDQIAELEQRLPEDSPFKISALFASKKTTEGIKLIKKRYDVAFFIGNDFDTPLGHAIYTLIDAGRLDDAITLAKNSPELVAYKQASLKHILQSYCFDCAPADDAFEELGKILILKGRLADAEEVSHYDFMGFHPDGCGYSSAVPTYAYYSKDEKIHAKTHQYCQCLVAKVPEYSKQTSSLVLGNLIGHDCIAPYPDILEQLRARHWQWSVCSSADVSCIEKEKRGQENLAKRRTPDFRSLQMINRSRFNVPAFDPLDGKITAENLFYLLHANEEAGNTEEIEKISEWVGKNFVRRQQFYSMTSSPFDLKYASSAFASLLTDNHLRKYVDDWWPVFLTSCVTTNSNCSESGCSDINFTWRGADAEFNQCVGDALDGHASSESRVQIPAMQQFDFLYPPILPIDAYNQ